jgi:hypothetical protein
MNGADPLAQLRDIHLPAPIGWWPPAPGWWLLGLLVLAVLATAGLLLRRYLRRNRYRRAALRELRILAATRAEYRTREAVEQIAILLRRVAIQTSGRAAVAPLAGESWLEFLDRQGGTDQFTTGPGRVLGESLYRPTVEADLDRLLPLVEKWIRRSRQC